MRIRIFLPGSGSAERGKTDPDPTLIRNEQIYIFILHIISIFSSGLCFVQDENDFMYPWLVVGSG